MQIISEVGKRRASKVKVQRGLDLGHATLHSLQGFHASEVRNRRDNGRDLRDARMIRVLGAPQRTVNASQAQRKHFEPLGCDVVSDASVPLAARCRVRTYDPADDRPFRGWKAGVYDASKTVCELSLTDRHWTRLTDPFNRNEVHPNEYRCLKGEAVYGGLLFHHFGHFLLESTARLWWPLRHGFKGPIIFQNTEADKTLPDFAAQFFDLLGLSDQIVVATTPLRYDRIVVPERSFVMKKRVHGDFRVPFLKAGEAVEALQPSIPKAEAEGAGLYLSRTRLPTRRSIGEQRLERTFVEAGFTVAHFEELPLRRQILLVRRHETIAGICGSALHNILFCASSQKTINICRDWDINVNFFMIDELMSNDATYIYGYSKADSTVDLSLRETFAKYWDNVRLDLPKIYRHLHEIGIG